MEKSFHWKSVRLPNSYDSTDESVPLQGVGCGVLKPKVYASRQVI